MVLTTASTACGWSATTSIGRVHDLAKTLTRDRIGLEQQHG